jgi:hypothetical protein
VRARASAKPKSSKPAPESRSAPRTVGRPPPPRRIEPQPLPLQREAAVPPAPPSAASSSVEDRYVIPTGYGEDRLVLMVKDPRWLFAYWEIRPETERSVRHQLLPSEIPDLRSVLRVYDVTDVEFPLEPAHRWFDITLSGLATSWYIETNAPNRSFIVEIGLLTVTGRFFMLARSNQVTAPRAGPSEIIDEAWATTDELFWKLIGSSALMSGSSPAAWAHLLSRSAVPGSWSSGSLAQASRPAMVRGFWCRINADVILYGTTDPKARVLVQGQPVTVRKDGTFSLRVTLPEGTQTMTIEATSADGRQTQSLTPVVSLTAAGSLGTESGVHPLPAERPAIRRIP